MWVVSGILIIGAVISFFEIWRLAKKKWWKEISVFSLFLSAGLTLAILLTLNVPIPTPIDWIMKIYNPISSFFERLLS
jgi:hypothetical protein